MTRHRFLLLCVALIGLLANGIRGEEPKLHSAIKPVPREGGWIKRHEGFNERAKKGNVDLIFIGDSITQGWEGAGKEVWKKHYDPRNAVNLGIGGDQTQHVLWRLEHGNIDGVQPKLAVLMIGTNNASSNTPQEIADGTRAIVGKLREKLPTTKVLILGVFPRGADKNNAERQVNQKTNGIVEKLADGEKVFYLDIGKSFLAEDETLSKEIMPDSLHLSPKGYQIWADAIEPKVTELMGKK